MPNRRVAAKVFKRLGQVGRLGPRGLLRTAFVRTLGPTAYSVTDPARLFAVRLHCRKAVTRDIGSRLERLKARVADNVPPHCGPSKQYGFGEDLGRFVQTLEAMLDLEAAGCSVPKVTGVNWTSHIIATESVVTKGVGEGADAQRRRATAIEEAVKAVHRAGYILGDIDERAVAFRNSDGRPILVDLRNAIPLAGLNRDMSIMLRDADGRRFNELFGTQLLTARELRGLLSPAATIPRDRVRGRFTEVYAPVVIRDDIRWGKIWNTDLGVGRWNFIMKDHLPIPLGGTVLDLGSNNGFNPLQMLRAGAASAVGVEIQAAEIEQAMFLKSVYEWLDNRAYDFRCIHASQRDLESLGLPRFDMITAFCSLYYLPDADIRELVRYIRTLTDVFVVQCNTDRLIDRGGNEETFRKASLEYALEVLEEGGFHNRTIVAPSGYSRPLVIGRTG